MADDAKRHPPSERKLSRLWRAGSTPASPALVAAAVIAAIGLLAAFAGPAVVDRVAGWVDVALTEAARPESALSVLRGIAIEAGLVAAVIGAVALGAAIAAQITQIGSRGGAASASLAARGEARSSMIDGWQGARALLLAALGGVAVAAAVRGVLLEIGRLSETPRSAELLQEPMTTIGAILPAVGWPLLIVLMAVAALDAIAGRALWLRGASMTRSEVEEEMRDTEGHPLTRERRSVTARRRSDA